MTRNDDIFIQLKQQLKKHKIACKILLATQLKLKGGRNNDYGCNQDNGYQNRINNKAI